MMSPSAWLPEVSRGSCWRWLGKLPTDRCVTDLRLVILLRRTQHESNGYETNRLQRGSQCRNLPHPVAAQPGSFLQGPMQQRALPGLSRTNDLEQIEDSPSEQQT